MHVRHQGGILVQEGLKEVILDPDDPEVIGAARAAGIKSPR